MSYIASIASRTLVSLLAVLVAWPALGQPGVAYEPARAAVLKAAPGAALSAPSAAPRATVVAAFLKSRGASDATVASVRDAHVNTAPTGVTHVRLEQRVDGLLVHGRYAKVAIDRQGRVLHLIDALAPVPRAALLAPSIGEADALAVAMAHLHPGVVADPTVAATSANTKSFTRSAFFHAAPTVTRVAIPRADGTMAVGFLVETWTQRTNLLHHTLVDGAGRILDVELRTAKDSYNVFQIDPSKTAQAVAQGPGAGNDESPIGWLGTGTQLTTAISGNNTDTYLDVDANDRADRGGSSVSTGAFESIATLDDQPSAANNRAVAVQNLFYHVNRIHDILYRHGFDEAAGNFQQENFGKGGTGRDPVQAEAQDGGDTDNADFATPPDGRKPRMQVYLWFPPEANHLVTVAGTDYDAKAAAFGPAFTFTGLTAPLATTTPANACTAIAEPLAGRIALIDRGACDFSLKVLNAQLAGAIAVVVANNTGTDEIVVMGAGEGVRRVRIPAVSVSLDTGNALKTHLGESTNVRRLDVQMTDAALDTDLIYHEYCHGLTWRMIGGMSGPIAGAIGEGMADGCAMLINGDDRMAEYASGLPGGIRSAPYAGYPKTYGQMNTGEVHADGEAYAAIVWRLMQDFGLARRDQLFAHLVDGMNYTPARPAYEHMRDGILAAVAASTTPSDACIVWTAFADFGVGEGASGVVNADGTVTITQSFDNPLPCP